MQNALENTNELLAFGTESLRRVRSALAPHGSRGWRVLPKMRLSAIGVSGIPRKARWQTKTVPSEGTLRFHFPQTDWRYTMSACLAVLPYLWAAAPLQPDGYRPFETSLAFYRKYTEGILRRYVHLSMEAGRVPSLLGQEMFRGRVTSYRVKSFDDVVIFVHDVGTCLAMLEDEEQTLISRIALQGHTQSDAAGLMGIHLKTVIRRYGHAVDQLTEIFIDAKLLDLQFCCQGVKTEE
jgi:hypothetical protein